MDLQASNPRSLQPPRRDSRSDMNSKFHFGPNLKGSLFDSPQIFDFDASGTQPHLGDIVFGRSEGGHTWFSGIRIRFGATLQSSKPPTVFHRLFPSAFH